MQELREELRPLLLCAGLFGSGPGAALVGGYLTAAPSLGRQVVRGGD
jgi:hypothetical protein